nr:hypothetical protein [uncultured Lichenicoccus sp.]
MRNLDRRTQVGLAAAIMATAAASLLAPTPAAAWGWHHPGWGWHHARHPGWGWHRGDGWDRPGFVVGVVRPPVIYAPLPIVAGPVWIRPHWNGPYWVPGHWG